jgi:hypothetical protein
LNRPPKKLGVIPPLNLALCTCMPKRSTGAPPQIKYIFFQISIHILVFRSRLFQSFQCSQTKFLEEQQQIIVREGGGRRIKVANLDFGVFYVRLLQLFSIQSFFSMEPLLAKHCLFWAGRTFF